MQTPFFSIVICNYNYAQFVGAAITSALAQDCPRDRFEVIVVDDGSTDASREVIESHADVLAIFQPNRGQTAAYEAGINSARGDYVCLLDSDDRYLPHKLTRVAQHLAQHLAQLDLQARPVFLCHDLVIEDSIEGRNAGLSWLPRVGVAATDHLRLIDDVTTSFPFSIPAGLVLSRSLCTRFFASLPAWSFPRGTDGVLCPAALIACGAVHYLHENLAVYRVHGSNEFASLVNGQIRPRFDPRVRAPKSLRFLEQWIDAIELEGDHRTSALAYLRRLEHLNRRPSASHRLADPLVSIVMFASDDALLLAASIEAAALQSHGAIELVLPSCGEPGPAAVSGARSWRHFDDEPQASDHQRLARALAACSGDYLVFVRAGDLLDREFVQRHVQLHQQGALVGVSCSDIRLIDRSGALVHADVFAGSGAWKLPVQHIPPLTTGLHDWVGVPMAACLFRRSELLNRLFVAPPVMGPALSAAAFWLAFQLSQQCAGVLRLRESLSSIRLPVGAVASYGYVGSAVGLDGTLLDVPVREAALWLQGFYLDHEDTFKRWLPASWHRGFEPWLDAHTG